MSVVIHRPAEAPEAVIGPKSGIPEYDEPILQRWLEVDGVRYWIEAVDKGHREAIYTVRDDSGEWCGDFFTLAEIRAWAQFPDEVPMYPIPDGEAPRAAS